MSIWKHWRDIGAIIGIVFLSFFSWSVLLNPGFFPMHDAQQIVRLSELDRALSGGQLPVRWVENLGFGYGYPLFNFYPPLTYYLGEIFHLGLNLGLIDSTKLVWGVALLGSALTMYFLARNFFGRLGGLVSAVFYLYAPYHAVDAYVRGAQSELFSFVWLPLILLFSHKTITTKSWGWGSLTGLVLGLLMLTHPLVFLPFSALFILWTIFFLSREKLSLGVILKSLVLPLILAAGLTAFFWLPSLAEKKFTLVDQLLIKNLASYKIHFVCPNQLWESQWGFGGSVSGCLDGLSFRLGKLHLLSVSLSLLLAAYLYITKRKIQTTVVVIAGLLFTVSALMVLPFSKPIWDALTPLWYLQFPWRFLEFAALFSSLLAGSVLMAVRHQLLKILIALVMTTTVLVTSAKLFSPKELYLWAKDADLASESESRWVVSSTSFEYMFKDTATKMSDLGTVLVDISKDEVVNEKFVVTNGDFVVSKSSFTADKFSISGAGTIASQLRININYFPGWLVWLNGEEMTFSHQNKLSLITVNIPPGSHRITGQFTNTPVRLFGNFVTLVTIGLLVGINYGSKLVKKNRAR